MEYTDHVRDVTIRYIYDGSNVIAEYAYEDSSLTGLRTYVNGAQYIDERVLLRDHMEDPVAGDDAMGQDHYYLLKELYTVAGLVSRNGAAEEYYVYDTYGDATMFNRDSHLFIDV